MDENMEKENEKARPRQKGKYLSKKSSGALKFWRYLGSGILIVAFICLMGWGVSTILDGSRIGNSGVIGDPTVPDPTGNVANSADQATDGVTDTTESETTEATEDPEILLQELRLQAEPLIKEAEFVAAGYDYQKAIEILQSFEHYDLLPELSEKVLHYREQDALLVTYPDMSKVTHIFFHSLIVDPARAFDRDGDSSGYNLYMTTCDEFWAMMEAMYARGFVLVSPYDVAYEVDGPEGKYFTYGEIRLPEGKKPFIMSQDDLNYYSYMIGTGSGVNETPIFADTNGDGFAHRIVIGDDGYPTCEYMDKSGNVTTGDYDLVPLLEKFIQEHPDFSYHGARAVLGMTGYEGVFGYRTKPSYENALGSVKYAQEVEAAKAVAQCLRDHGWILASHSYGHPAYGNISADRVRADSDKWENTVQPIIGDCDIILYPHGSDIARSDEYTKDNAKFVALYEDGYRYFFNVDSSVYWSFLGDTYYRGGRRNLDGYRMWHHPKRLADLFDVNEVFDKARPTPVPSL